MASEKVDPISFNSQEIDFYLKVPIWIELFFELDRKLINWRIGTVNCDNLWHSLTRDKTDTDHEKLI